MARSPNPDLLFEDVLEERAQRITKTWCGELAEQLPEVLDRVTVFVTHRCNLRCRYCNGPHLCKTLTPELRREMLVADLPAETFNRLIEDWARHHLRHIHFTGGEATLHPGLPSFVLQATRLGIPSSITTNGTAPFEFYRDLIKNGLSELRISIDSLCEADFDATVGVPGTFRKVHQTIRRLIELKRTGGERFFVILNACVGAFNLDSVRATMRGLMEFAPDDIKLLAVAEEASSVSARARRAVVDELLNEEGVSDGEFELLPRKIQALFRRGSFGLADATSQHVLKHCYIPLTERTLDGRGFYPCSLYVRYGGSPIAPLEAGLPEQQASIVRFVKEHACSGDAICRANCSACCREFNLKVNLADRETAALAEARRQPVIEIGPISRAEVSEVRRMHRALRGKVTGTGRPFMVVKPFGLEQLDEIRAYLQSQGVVIMREERVARWQEAALFLHLRDAVGLKAAYRIARNHAYAFFEGLGPAHVLWLERGVPYRKLARIKMELRTWYGERYRHFRYRGEEHLLHTNCIHMPDEADVAFETAVLEQCI